MKSPIQRQMELFSAALEHPAGPERDAWHRHEAWRCESTKDWSNAVTHLSALLETHPDSGDFLPRRAAAYVAWAGSLETNANARSAPVLGRSNAGETNGVEPARTVGRTNASAPEDGRTPAAADLLQRALADYNRTLAWVDRYPAIAKESRKPFDEKRCEIYLKLGRTAEAAADERELKKGTPR